MLSRYLGEITAAVEQSTPVAVADRAVDPSATDATPRALDHTGVSEAVNGERFLPTGVASLP